MTATSTLVVYCVAILLVSVLGGFIPAVVRLTHRRLQLALSLVSGVMLGVGLLHMLGHAVEHSIDATFHGIEAPGIHGIMLATLVGFMALFMLERFFCFHHHEAEGEEGCGHHDHDHGPSSDHAFGWVGALVGLSVHTLIAGFALGAAVGSTTLHEPAVETAGLTFAGFGVFLGILLHKPFDAFTIIALMRRQGLSRGSMFLVNGLFALVIPLGVLLFVWGVDNSGGDAVRFTIYALAFSAGTFICIAASDLLPELHFHSHDRVAMTAMLIIGLVIAWGSGLLEHSGHDHHHHHGMPNAPAATVPMPTMEPGPAIESNPFPFTSSGSQGHGHDHGDGHDHDHGDGHDHDHGDGHDHDHDHGPASGPDPG
ncbi:MAG: ZIP family metal transporter [Phycisphaerales bacterium]|nr:ZIP family metal transporter [Phycisphaerales bacterium]